MKFYNHILKVATIVFSIVVVFSCSDDIKNLDKVDLAQLTNLDGRIPENTSENFEINYYKAGRVNITIGGKKLKKYPQLDSLEALEELLDSVHVLFYDDDGKVVNELTSKYAIRFANSGIMEAKKDVVVFNKKGEKLNTEHLIWDPKKEEIYSDTDVVITKEKQVIRGTGLRSDQNFNDYEIINPKNSKFYLNEK